MDTEELINILTYYHLQEFSSRRERIQALQEDEYARNLIAPAGGLKRSTFFTIYDRGVKHLLYVFTELQKNTSGALPNQHAEPGEQIAIDESLIDSVLSMHWAERPFVSRIINQGQLGIYQPAESRKKQKKLRRKIKNLHANP